MTSNLDSSPPQQQREVESCLVGSSSSTSEYQSLNPRPTIVVDESFQQEPCIPSAPISLASLPVKEGQVGSSEELVVPIETESMGTRQQQPESMEFDPMVAIMMEDTGPSGRNSRSLDLRQHKPARAPKLASAPTDIATSADQWQQQQLRDLQEYQKRRFHSWVKSQTRSSEEEEDADAETHPILVRGTDASPLRRMSQARGVAATFPLAVQSDSNHVVEGDSSEDDDTRPRHAYFPYLTWQGPSPRPVMGGDNPPYQWASRLGNGVKLEKSVSTTSLQTSSVANLAHEVAPLNTNVPEPTRTPRTSWLRRSFSGSTSSRLGLSVDVPPHASQATSASNVTPNSSRVDDSGMVPRPRSGPRRMKSSSVNEIIISEDEELAPDLAARAASSGNGVRSSRISTGTLIIESLGKVVAKTIGGPPDRSQHTPQATSASDVAPSSSRVDDSGMVPRPRSGPRRMKSSSVNEIIISEDEELPPYVDPHAAPINNARRSRASTSSMIIESLGKVVGRTMGRLPDRSQRMSQGSADDDSMRWPAISMAPPLRSGLSRMRNASKQDVPDEDDLSPYFNPHAAPADNSRQSRISSSNLILESLGKVVGKTLGRLPDRLQRTSQSTAASSGSRFASPRMDEDAVNRLANRYKGKKKLSGNRLNVSVDAAMAPYFKPKPAPMDEFRKSRASTGTYQQESLDMVVARTLGLPPTRSRLGSQNSNASFNATVRGSASSSSTMSYWASRQQRRPSDKPFEVSVDLSDPASSYFPTLDVGPDSVPKPESPHAHVELHAGAELPEAYGDGLVVGLDEELEPPPPRAQRNSRISYASVSINSLEDREDADGDDDLETEFGEFHFRKVRYSAAVLLVLALGFWILPVLLIKVIAVLDEEALQSVVGKVSDNGANWSDPSCQPSMRKAYIHIAAFSTFAAIVVSAVVMLLRNQVRRAEDLFSFCSVGVVVASSSGLAAWLYVNKPAVINIQLMIMALPAAFRLRTKHSILGVAPAVVVAVIMTALGRTSDDMCKSATNVVFIMVVVALVAVFQSTLMEAQLRRLYESSKLHKEQLKEQKNFLKHMLPPQALRIALAGTSTTQGNEFECGTIMMVDVNMEEAANLMAPSALVEGLDRIFIFFDVLIESAPKTVYKVETVGSVYMVASGVPFKHPDHAHLMLETALQFLDTTASLQWNETLRMKIRCGVHSGKLFAGVPGMVCPRYRYFGDTVNTAARLESKAPWGRVWVSEATMLLLQNPLQIYNSRSLYNWGLLPLGNFWFKGKGNLPVFEVELDLELNRTKVVVRNVESEATHTAELSATEARKRMSKLLESPSLLMRDSDHSLYANNTSFSDFNRLSNWIVSVVAVMRKWKGPSLMSLHCCGLWLFAEAKDFTPDLVQEVDFKDSAMTLLLTFKNPSLEYHHRCAESNKCRRVVLSAGLLSLAMVTWCVAALASAGCDVEQRTALLVHTGVALILAMMLSFPLIVQFHWTVRWWPCISLLLLLLFMAWQIALPCGDVSLSSFPAQQGTAFIWIMLAHAAFALPFRFCVLSTVVAAGFCILVAIPEDCKVDARVVWGECEYPQNRSGHNYELTMLVPVLIALHTFWENEACNRRQFVKVLQAHHGRRQAVSVVKSLLPEHVFRMQGQLSNSNMLINHYIPVVNQLFSDIVGFTSQAAQMKPIAVFEMIATLFGVFDELTDKLGVLKIETIGDAYWACTGSVSGGECLPMHATSLALFGFEMQEEASKIFPLGPDKPSLKIRIGLHSGPVVGGITGTTMPRYHFFGPHVALTNQMESLGSAHYLHVTNSFATLLRRDVLCPPDFDVITRDPSLATGQGMPQCENIKWEQVNRAMNEYGQKLRLELHELQMLTPVATITRQQGFYVHVRLKMQGNLVVPSFDIKFRSKNNPCAAASDGSPHRLMASRRSATFKRSRAPKELADDLLVSRSSASMTSLLKKPMGMSMQDKMQTCNEV